MAPAMMEDLIRSLGRRPRERTTLYAPSMRGAAERASAATSGMRSCESIP
jgi:hypothetical protein